MFVSLLDNKERVGGLLLLVFALAYLRAAWNLPLDPSASDEMLTPRTLPMGLASAMIFFSLLQLLARRGVEAEARISETVRDFQWSPMLLLIAMMAVYAQLFSVLGFAPSSFLFLFLGFLILGERRILFSVMVAAGLVLFLWVMLTQVFGLYLDSGDLFRVILGVAS
ncbi:MAG: tripartite tricarboxylate transporter TctB family protein [Pseudomonadota bacterium]